MRSMTMPRGLKQKLHKTNPRKLNSIESRFDCAGQLKPTIIYIYKIKKIKESGMLDYNCKTKPSPINLCKNPIIQNLD
jgi:hypothetical protein